MVLVIADVLLLQWMELQYISARGAEIEYYLDVEVMYVSYETESNSVTLRSFLYEKLYLEYIHRSLRED